MLYHIFTFVSESHRTAGTKLKPVVIDSLNDACLTSMHGLFSRLVAAQHTYTPWGLVHGWLCTRAVPDL